MFSPRQCIVGPTSAGSSKRIVRLGSAVETTSGTSTSAPSARVTPCTRSPRVRIATTSCWVRSCTPRAVAAASSASASASVPPRAKTAVPAAPPSVPAESFSSTCAVPVAQAPIAVYRTPRVQSGPLTDSSSKTSWTRSATAIGSARIASRPVFAPRSRKALPSRRPMIASASEGDLGSGGMATCTYARKLAIARILWSNPTKASASRTLRGRSSSAVLAASAQNVVAEPSGIGACIRTAGATVEYPKRSSRRSFMTEERRRPTVWINPGARNPGAGWLPRRMPPGRSARSSTTTLRPALASDAAAISPLWPAPITTVSIVLVIKPPSGLCASPSGTRAPRSVRARP